MEKLNIAVIGIGVMGKNHARVYSSLESVNLIAVCDNNEETAKNIAKQYGINYYKDYNELLKKEKIDAVSICVPTKLHNQVALDVIKNKVNLLIEKPIATTIGEAKEIIHEAEKNKVKLMVGHIERFNPVIIELKKLIEKGALGKVFLVKSERFSPFPKRVVDIGVTIDLSVHDVDIMQHLLKSKVKSVYCINSMKIHSKHEDLMTSILKFADGAIGTISCNWITPKIVRELTVIGEKGMYKADYLAQELVMYKNDFTDKYIDWEKRILTVTPGDMMKINIVKKEPLRNEIESFIRCIVDDSEPPVSGEEGLESLNIALKFLESSKSNEVIHL